MKEVLETDRQAEEPEGQTGENVAPDIFLSASDPIKVDPQLCPDALLDYYLVALHNIMSLAFLMTELFIFASEESRM